MRLLLGWCFLVLSFAWCPSGNAATLRAAWLFDQGSLVGIGPAATMPGVVNPNTGCAPSYVPGVFGGLGIQFKGVDPDSVSFPGTQTSLEFGMDPYSVVVWIQSNHVNNVRFFRTQDNAGSLNGLNCAHNGGSGTLRFNQRDSGNFVQCDSAGDPADGACHMFVLVRRQGGEVLIYQDGSSMVTMHTPAIVNLINYQQDLILANGFFGDVGTQLVLDDIAFFDGELTAAEVDQLSQCGLVSFLEQGASGNVNVGNGTRADVLFVDGSSGGATRTVTTTVNSPIEVTLDTAPAGPASARYVFWAWVAGPTLAVNLGAAGQSIGCLMNPTPFHSGLSPQPFRCVRGSGIPIFACAGTVVTSGPPTAPWSLNRGPGLANPMTISMQALLEDSGSANATGFSVTNGVVLQIQ